MEQPVTTEKDRQMAQVCVNCPVCTRARKNQKGLACWFVKTIEGEMCPYCKAYAKVYGRKPHEPQPMN
jgi:CxxC motif-containing protein